MNVDMKASPDRLVDLLGVISLPCYLSHFPMKPLGSLGLPSWWRCHWSVCSFLSHFNLAKCNWWKIVMCKRCTDMTNWDKLDIMYIFYIIINISLQLSAIEHVWKCSEVLLIGSLVLKHSTSPCRPSCHTPKGVIFFGHALDQSLKLHLSWIMRPLRWLPSSIACGTTVESPCGQGTSPIQSRESCMMEVNSAILQDENVEVER